MSITSSLRGGAIIKRAQFEMREQAGCRVAQPICRDTGATAITATVVEIPTGASWPPAGVPHDQETIGVIFAGRGTAWIGRHTARLERASTFYAPTGTPFHLHADGESTISLYLWQSTLPPRARRSSAPRLVNSLWNDETYVMGVSGPARMDSHDHSTAHLSAPRMHLLFWPGSGSAQLCLHCGMQEPGQSFSVHAHPVSEEVFVAFEGCGQGHLDGRWIDMEAGDMLYAPAGLPHGARNPHTGPGAARFAVCGGPTPFDAMLYERVGVSADVK
jgi:mannose-6-phosphate isomerase-like protein (cupin superfamily)